MKKWLLPLILLVSVSAVAQVDSTTPPYKKFPTLPPIQILLGDSTTKFTKENLPAKKPVLVMLFSPDCSHCQHETEEFIAHREAIKDLQIVMITFHPLSDMNAFISRYKLNELPNIVVGKDIYWTMPAFYDIHNLPFHAMYDKKGNLIEAFEGSMELNKVLQAFNK